MSTPLRLVHSANKTAQTADTISAKFARALSTILRDTERRLRPLLVDAKAGSPTAVVQAAQADQVRRELRTALRQAGYDELAAQATDAPFDRMAARVLTTRRLALQSAALSRGIVTRMDALKALHLGNLLEQGDDVAKALWQATLRGVFGSRSVDRILSDLAGVLEDTEPHIRTLYDTSISIYGRQVEALQAGDREEATFAYMGPVDQVTRDFCVEYAGRVLTRAEIDDLDNGQLDNVFLTGGGYNCRHTWIEVSRFSELRDLVGTEARVPEIQTQLDDLEEAA